MPFAGPETSCEDPSGPANCLCGDADCTAAAPEGSGVAPEGREADPEGKGAASKGNALDPEGSEVTTEGNGAAPKGKGDASEGKEAAPEGKVLGCSTVALGLPRLKGCSVLSSVGLDCLWVTDPTSATGTAGFPDFILQHSMHSMCGTDGVCMI